MRRPRHRRGYSAVELVVTLLVLAILAGIVTVACTALSGRAHQEAARAQVDNVTTTVASSAVAHHQLLDRAGYADAITAGATPEQVSLGDANTSPVAGGWAVGFTDSAGPVQDSGGDTAALLTSDGSHVMAQVAHIDGHVGPVLVEPLGTTPAQVLTSAAAAS